MQKKLNIVKSKMVVYPLIINLIFLFIFFYSIMDQTGGWGNIDLFIKLIFIFPILVFGISFTFSSFNERVIFNYLSFLIYGVIIINQFNLFSIELKTLIKLVVLIISPLILALFQHGVCMIVKKIGEK